MTAFQSELNTVINLYSSTMTIMEKTLSAQHEKLSQLEKQNTQLAEENARLKALLKSEQQHRFGKSSESSPKDNAGSNDESSAQTTTVKGHKRRKKTKNKGRLLSTDHLPCFEKYYDLADDEKQCKQCDGQLHFIKKNSTKQLEIIPLRYCVVEHIQFVYGCRGCDSVISAPRPQAPLPKAMAGSSLLADIAINKYQAHQPLYRQSKMMKSEDILIPDNTLGNWMMKLGFALEPLYQAMWCILKQRYLQVDETPVKILEPDKKGYLWAYYSPHIGKHRGLLVFELSETRSGSIAQKRLAPFNGLLQTDAYQGYDALRKSKPITGLGCFTHARRKFSEVVKISNDSEGIAAQMLEKMKPLYQLEARMRELEASFHTRKRLRQKIARPITKEIHRWLRSVKPRVPPGSKLGKAICYTLRQWPYLIAYLRHGQAEIDTNEVENKIREVALGKKNWLFIGNKKSGVIHAIFYSLIISCVLNNINPRVYLHYVITKVHEIRKREIDLESILPHCIEQKMLDDFAEQQIAFAKKVLNL